MKQFLAILLVFIMTAALAACGKNSGSTDTAAVSLTAANSEAESAEADDMFTSRDYEVGWSDEVTVTLKDGASKAGGDGVSIENDTITITSEGTYLLTGTLRDGQIVVDLADNNAKVQLVLDNANISNSSGAAILIKSADKVFLTTAAGTENSVTSTADFSGVSEDEDGTTVDAAIFSKEDLTLNGEGTLTVTCESGHGIVSKDDLKMTSGTYAIAAGRKGISGKDSVRIAGGSVTVDSGKTAIHSGNTEDEDKGFVYIKGGTLTLTAGNDGIHAERALTIAGGTITVTESNEALEGATIEITGGKMDVTAADDGLNASGFDAEATDTADAGNDGFMNQFMGGKDDMQPDDTAWLLISGGELYVNAGGDALDSNGDLTITGGTVYADGPTNGGNGTMDYAGNGKITGGTVILAGAAGMEMNFGQDSTQCSILYDFSSPQAAGTTVTLKDSSGNVVAEYTPQKSYQSVVISTPDLKTGETYTLSAGSESAEIDLTDVLYGTTAGMGGMPGMGGQGGPMGSGKGVRAAG